MRFTVALVGENGHACQERRRTDFHDTWQETANAYSSAITFDAGRGGLVREIVHVPDPGKPALIRGEIEPIKVEGHWLPKRVAYSCTGGLFFTWEMDWVSVNEPIPQDLFEQGTLLTLLGLTQ